MMILKSSDKGESNAKCNLNFVIGAFGLPLFIPE